MTEPDTQKPPSWQAKAKHGESRKRGADLTPAQSAKLLAAAARLPTDERGRMQGAAALCKDAGLGSPDYITRTLLPSVEALNDDPMLCRLLARSAPLKVCQPS